MRVVWLLLGVAAASAVAGCRNTSCIERGTQHTFSTNTDGTPAQERLVVYDFAPVDGCDITPATFEMRLGACPMEATVNDVHFDPDGGTLKAARAVVAGLPGCVLDTYRGPEEVTDLSGLLDVTPGTVKLQVTGQGGGANVEYAGSFGP
jgi:hypothetical protein